MIRHPGFTETGLREVPTSAEHACEIGEAPRNSATGPCAVPEDLERFPEDEALLLRKLATTVENNVRGLHADAHCLRREPLRAKQFALNKLDLLEGHTVAQ